ncbi:MAG: DUF898 family protein [Myxococcales bacterium]
MFELVQRGACHGAFIANAPFGAPWVRLEQHPVFGPAFQAGSFASPLVGAVGAGAGAGRYAFQGNWADYLGLELVNVLLILISCGLAKLLGIDGWRRSKWSTENTTIDGARLRYLASWSTELGHHLVAVLFVMISCGLALPWIVAWDRSFHAQHTCTADGRRVAFDGTGIEVLGLLVAGLLLLPLTLGLAWPWLVVAWAGWDRRHTLVQDPRAPQGWVRLRLDAGGLAFLVEAAFVTLLMLLTFGLYGVAAIPRAKRWLWGATSDELSPAISVPIGPRTTGDWAVVGGAAALAVVLVIGVVSVASQSPSVSTATFDEDHEPQERPVSPRPRSTPTVPAAAQRPAQQAQMPATDLDVPYSFETYRNDKYGYQVDVATVLTNPTPFEGDAGRQWTYGERGLMNVAAISGKGWTIGEWYQAASREPGFTAGTVQTDWFFKTGRISGRIFWQKSILRADVLYTARLEYDEARKVFFDPIVARVAASLQAP